MARRVFLHVGTPKSGTSYLQSLWWKNHDLLAAQGLLLPGSRLRDHFHAASVVCARTEVVERLDEQERHAWDRLIDEARRWKGDALISHELFSPAPPDRARLAVEALERAVGEVHVVVTARDLARQLRSDWQQNVKQGRSETLTRFWEIVRDDPTDEWWLYQDLPALLDRWTAGLPPERVHLVVLPPEGSADRGWLWQATCGLLDVEATGLDSATERGNESLGVVEIEVMRRVQAALPESEHGLDMRRLTKDYFAVEVLAPVGAGERFTLPPALHAWARERGNAMSADLRRRGYDVIGDLDNLEPMPVPAGGRTPDEVLDSEVAEVAARALARMLQHEKRRRVGAPAERGARPSGAPHSGQRDQESLLNRLRRTLGRRP